MHYFELFKDRTTVFGMISYVYKVNNKPKHIEKNEHKCTCITACITYIEYVNFKNKLYLIMNLNQPHPLFLFVEHIYCKISPKPANLVLVYSKFILGSL